MPCLGVLPQSLGGQRSLHINLALTKRLEIGYLYKSSPLLANYMLYIC